jgi:uncharacterized LabA/DUF88 family protein
MHMNFVRRGFRVGVFVDNVNLYVACRDVFGRTPNHAVILKEAVADNVLFRAIAYGVRLNDGIERWRTALERFGYEIREKTPHNGKADWDVDIVVDVWRMIEHLDMVVIVSGDGDFTALVHRCHELGKIVRVIGVDGSTSGALVAACDEFVPITEAMLLAKKEES